MIRSIEIPEDRRVQVLVATIGSMLLAGILIVGFAHPVPVIAVLFIIPAALSVAMFPVAALVLALFLIPFHVAVFLAVNYRAGLATGALDYWKDVLIVGLFVRAVVGRARAEGRLRIPRTMSDVFLLAYVAGYMVIAALSPKIPGVSVALARIVEGPLLFLAIRYLRLTRKQLWACICAILAAATIIGGAAVFERFGPRDKFLTWYGAVEPTRVNGSFFIGKSYRPGSFIDSPLVLAFYLAGAMPFAAAIAAVRTRWRLLALIAFAACGLGLLVTVTRSGYIGGGVGLILVLALAIRNPGVRVSLLGIVLVASSGLAVTYAARNSQIFLRPGGTEGHRKALQQDIKLVLKKPLGYGLARTDAIAQRFKAQGIKGGPIVTESTILAKAIEGGIPGLILYLSAIFLLLFRLRASRIRALDRDDHAAVAIAAGGMGAVVGVFLSGMFLGVSELVVEVILWGCAGIALAFCATRPRENAAA